MIAVVTIRADLLNFIAVKKKRIPIIMKPKMAENILKTLADLTGGLGLYSSG